MQSVIHTFVINLGKRTDRKTHIMKQFLDKSEFNVQIINAIEKKNGSLGLWQTIKYIIEKSMLTIDDEYILICEDDHTFTNDYNSEEFLAILNEAKSLEAELLLGGVSWYDMPIQITANLFWVASFTALQFTLIHKNLFSKILEADFGECDAVDIFIGSMTEQKFVISPFISIQKEFGYSDATPMNNKQGRVDELFLITNTKLLELKQVASFYGVNFN